MSAQPTDPDRPDVPCTARARSVHPDCKCHRCGKVRWRRRQLRELGLLRPVTSDQAWAVIEWMRARRWTAHAISSATGVPVQTIGRALHDDEAGRRPAWREGTAAAIVNHGWPTAGSISATGTARRIRAMLRLGWSLEAISTRTGYAVTSLSRHARAEATIVHPDLAAAVTAMFDAVGDTVGGSYRVAQKATAAGYAPGYAWVGLDMDDPGLCLIGYRDADRPSPSLQERTRRRRDRDRRRAERRQPRGNTPEEPGPGT